jgi:seryl-tRNA synthetase
VHQFSKVEMFVVCAPHQSDALHQELIDLEAAMFEELGLHFKVGGGGFGHVCECV